MKKIIPIFFVVFCFSYLLQAQTLKLTSPDGQENWQLGSVHAITWTATGISQKVKLILLKDGAKVGLIADDLDAP